jgi:hypothetical protein
LKCLSKEWRATHLLRKAMRSRPTSKWSRHSLTRSIANW